ncbi:hypothetical protein F0402_05475 [Mycolicibacter arupensis]|nr:hypothetical protein F0402_05475 [Mycolicibacter arupensis]
MPKNPALPPLPPQPPNAVPPSPPSPNHSPPAPPMACSLVPPSMPSAPLPISSWPLPNVVLIQSLIAMPEGVASQSWPASWIGV